MVSRYTIRVKEEAEKVIYGIFYFDEVLVRVFTNEDEARDYINIINSINLEITPENIGCNISKPLTSTREILEKGELPGRYNGDDFILYDNFSKSHDTRFSVVSKNLKNTDESMKNDQEI